MNNISNASLLGSDVLVLKGLIHGQVLILGTDNNDFALLSPKQVEIVKRETKLIRGSGEI